MCRQVRNLECSQKQRKCTHKCTFNADAEPVCNFLHILYFLTSCKILQVRKEHSNLWLCCFFLPFPTRTYYARYQGSAALLLKIQAFWDVVLCNWVSVSQCFDRSFGSTKPPTQQNVLKDLNSYWFTEF
jgi:hypothetical protein